MLTVCAEFCQDADILIMAAAVADFRPTQTASTKIKREKGLSEHPLEATPISWPPLVDRKCLLVNRGVLVGFAAESQELLHNARQNYTPNISIS
jgi:phosphopantothenoylcysteine decarboxylase/phosphopantothenate--cysteine ligase